MIKKLLFGLILLFATICNAETIQKGWNTFEGSIGKSDIVVNIYCDSIGNLSGDYCYKKHEIRIAIKGKRNGNIFFLDEFIDTKINAKFNGKINEEDNTISGKWSSTTHSDIAFSLKLASWTGGNLDNRYAFGTDEEIESFVKKIKSAFVNDDKIWISKNIKYPITVSVLSKKVKVKTAKEFTTKYSKIVNEKYKNDIKNSCICNIFSNWRGAMIANGLVWINEYDDKGLKISAINN